MNTSPEYIAAAELVSPNSPEFESTLHRKESEALQMVKKHLSAKLFELLNHGHIGDNVYTIAYDAIQQID